MALSKRDMLALYGLSELVKLELAVPPQQPVGLPGQTIAQGAAAAGKAAGAGSGSGRHVASAAGVAHYKVPLGSLIIPHARHLPGGPGGGARFVKGEPGHWVHGYISQEKWIANQWHGKPHAGMAHQAVAAGSHKWVQAGDKTVAVHHGVQVHVPKTTDLSDETAVKHAPKVLVHQHEGKTEHALLQSNAGLGPPGAPSPGEKEALGKHWKPLPDQPSKKSVTFEGRHAAWVPHDWQVHKKPGVPEAHLGGKFAKDPQGTWHFIGKNGELGAGPSNAEEWAKKGHIVPDEPSAPPIEHNVPHAGEPGHEPVKVDVGGVSVTKDQIHSAISHLNAAQSTNVKGPLKSKGHPLAAMDYMGISKEVLAKHPELKVSPGTKKAHVGQVKLAVLHHLQSKLNRMTQNEAEAAIAEEVKKDAEAAAEHAAKLTPAIKNWGGVDADKEQLAEAADWLVKTMGGHGSFKQAMTKAGNPLAGADYMGAAKTYKAAHPNTAKGWSTKQLMLESIMELTNLAAKADTATGHDHHVLLDDLIGTGTVKPGWEQSADGATTKALKESASIGTPVYAFLSDHSPGVWVTKPNFPPNTKGYLEATPEHKVFVHYASGGKHEMTQGNVEDIAKQWVAKPEPVKPAPLGKVEELPPEPQPKPLSEVLARIQKLHQEQKPEPKVPPALAQYPSLKKPKGLGVPPALAKFLKGEPDLSIKSGHGDTPPKQIAQALLQSKKNGFPIYVGHVDYSGKDDRHSWIWQFVKPGGGTWYRAEAIKVGADIMPTLVKHEDGEPGVKVYSAERLAEIVKGAAPGEPEPPKPSWEPPPAPKAHFTAQKPSSEWVAEPEWPAIHALVKDAQTMKAGELPDMDSTDNALANGLWITEMLKQDLYTTPKEEGGGWTNLDNAPAPGSFGASTAAGYYKVTPDHQIIQFDKDGNETSLPPENVQYIAGLLKPKLAEWEKELLAAPEPKPLTVKGHEFPAGSKAYAKAGNSSIYVYKPDGTWTKVYPDGKLANKSANAFLQLYGGWVKSGELKPQVREKAKPEPKTMVTVKVGWHTTQFPAGSKVYMWNPDSSTAKQHGFTPETVKYVKDPQGTWWVITPDAGKKVTYSQDDTVAKGTLVPYGEMVPVAWTNIVEYHAPAGTTAWYDATDDPKTQAEAYVYLRAADGSWQIVGKHNNFKPESSANSNETLNEGIKTGDMKPHGPEAEAFAKTIQAKTATKLPPLPDEQKIIPIHVKGKKVTTVPGASEVYHGAGGDSGNVNFKYVKKPDGTWEKWGGSGFAQKYDTSSQKTKLQNWVVNGTLVKDLGAKAVFPAPPEVAQQIAQQYQPDISVKLHGEEIAKVPAGSKVYWYNPTPAGSSAPPASEANASAMYVQHPDGSWWVYQKNYKDVGAAGGYADYVKSGALVPSGEKSGDAALAELKAKLAPPEEPGIPVIVNDMKKATVPAGSKFYKAGPGMAQTPAAKAAVYVKKPNGAWIWYGEKGVQGGNWDHQVKAGHLKEIPSGEIAPNVILDKPPEEIKPEEPKPDIPVIINDVVSGHVPAGSEFFSHTDSYGSKYLYIKKPDGKWNKAKTFKATGDYSSGSVGYMQSVYGTPSAEVVESMTPAPGPTEEQIAQVAEIAALKEQLGKGTHPVKPSKTWQDRMVFELTSKSMGYLSSVITIWQGDNGHWNSYSAPAGKDYYSINPKNLAVEHVIPPSPGNEQQIIEKIPYAEVKAAINEHLVPNAVNIGGHVYKHGYWYNPKGKAYLEIKPSSYGGGYHGYSKADYIWHQVNGSTKDVTYTFAAKQLEKNTEYQSVPKPVEAVPGIAKQPSFTTVAGPGDFNLFSKHTPGGIAPDSMTVLGDGSAVHKSSGAHNAIPAEVVTELLKGGTLLDKYGTTVIKPGIVPNAYHLFGHASKSGAAVGELLQKVEQAGSTEWQQHLFDFFGTGKAFAGKPGVAEGFKGWWADHQAVTHVSQQETFRAMLRELLVIPAQEAAAPFEPTFLKSMPEGIHSSKQVFKWTPNGWATPYSGLLKTSDLGVMSSPHLTEKIKAISEEYGGGKVVGTHPASMTKDQKLAWLKAWKAGDMSTVFTIDSHTGKVSPVHPGAPKNAVTHQVSWSPLDPSQLPASKVPEGDWTPTDVIMPKAEVNNYLIKMGFQHAEYLTEGQKMSLVGVHRVHDQDAVDAATKMANDKHAAGGVTQTPTPVWTKDLKPAKSYDAYVHESQAASNWTGKAIDDFMADNAAEMAPFQQQLLDKHGYSSWNDLPSYYKNEAIQSWMDDVHAKVVQEQSKPVWKQVPLGPTGSHGHAIFKYTKTIPYTGEVTTWYVKPAPTSSSGGTGAWRLEQEHAANSLGRLFGFATAQSDLTDVEGKQQLAIAELKGSILGHYTDMPPWSEFTPEQIAELAGEHALDWVLANDDSSANNIIQREDGHLVGIDKGRAWGNMKWDGLAGDHKMDSMTQLAFTKLYDAIRSHEVSKEVADQAFTALIHKVRKMQAVPDAKVRAILEAGFANRPKAAKFGNPEDIITETLARKNSLEEDFTKMWAKVYKDAGYAETTTPDPHAPGSAWGPIKGDARYGMVLFDDQGRIMLREPSNHYGGYAWTFAKGGGNPGETPLETAIRETAEETDLKASGSIGYVPGGYGGTTSTSYFHLGLKSSTSHHPEMNNGETWNVKWVTQDEAKQLIAQTESETGKARDLQVLDAAFAAHAEAKKNGFPELETPGAGTGLPFIPKAKLPVGPNGVQLHAGFSEPDFMDHVAESKSFGTPAFFGGPDMEYGHVIVWREFEGAGTDKPIIRGETGARGQGLSNLLSWAKAHVTGGGSVTPKDDTQTVYEGAEGFPGRAPEGSADRGELTGELGMYNKIITAARSVSRHAVDKKFNASALQELDNLEQKLTDTLTGIEALPQDNPWRIAAEPVVKLYLGYAAQVKTAKETGGTFANGDLPRYLGPAKPKEKPKPAPDVKVTTVSPSKMATMETGKHALNPADGELHVNSNKHVDFEAGGAKVYLVELKTGEKIEIWGGSNEHVELAHRGHIKFQAVAADGSASLERIRAQLTDMGLPMEEATPADLELYYWRHLYGILNDRKDRASGKHAYVTTAVDAAKKEHGISPTIDLERGGLSPDEEIGIWRKAWANLTSDQHIEEFTDSGGHLPHLKHYNPHDPTVAGGRPVWMRFDVTRDMTKDFNMPNHVFFTFPDVGAMRIVRSGGQYSKDFRFRHLGLSVHGQGNGPDTGATGFVFGNQNKESEGHVLINPRIYGQTQNYAWSGDHWGRTYDRNHMANFDVKKMAAINGMEIMTPGAWTLLDDIEAVKASGETQRKEIIDYLHSIGLYEIRGMKVEDRIGTSNTWSETRKKVRANWAAHPELLDPHSVWSPTTTAGAQAAESGKTAAHVATPDLKWTAGKSGKVFTAADYQIIKDPASGKYDLWEESGNIKSGYPTLEEAKAAAVAHNAGQPVHEPGGGAPGSKAEQLVSDPGNEVYTYSGLPDMKYVKLPDGGWKIIEANGNIIDHAANSAGAHSLNGSITDGSLKLQGEAVPTLDELLAYPGNEVYGDPSLPGKQYIKDKQGGWYVVKKDGTMHYNAPGSAAAADYSDLLDSGGLFKATMAVPAGTITAGQVAAGEIVADLIPSHIPVYTGSSATGGNGFVQVVLPDGLSLHDYFHSYGEGLHQIAEQQEKYFEKVIENQDELIKALTSIPPS